MRSRRRSSSVRKIVTVGCAALSIAGAVAALAPTPACTTHQCDPPTPLNVPEDVGRTAGQVDPNTWESSPLDAPWLNCPGMMTYALHMPQFAGREVLLITPYLAVGGDPVSSNGVFVPAAGNATEFVLQTDAGVPFDPPIINVLNDSCAQYWLRVVVTFAAVSASDGGADSESDAPPEQ
jgi:hypothetical protein